MIQARRWRALLLGSLIAVLADAGHARLSAAERFILNGVVILDNEEGYAWLQEPGLTNGGIVLLRRGERLGSWTLTRILPARVELTGPAGTVVVPLSSAPGHPPLSVAARLPIANDDPPTSPSAPVATAAPDAPQNPAAVTVAPEVTSEDTDAPLRVRHLLEGLRQGPNMTKPARGKPR